MRKKNSKKLIEAKGEPTELRICGASEGFELQAADAADGKKLRKFSMTAYTGDLMDLPNFSYPVVAELSGMDVTAQAVPIFMNHDHASIIAHSDVIEKTAQRLKVTGLMSGVGPHSQEVMALADNGFPWQASIGAKIGRLEFIDKGQKVTINGRALTGPLHVARQTSLKEISFVPIGADRSGTRASIAAGTIGETMNPFEMWLTEKGFDPAQVSDQQKKTLEATWKAETAPPPALEKPAKTYGELDDVVTAAKNELDRKRQITEIVAEALQERPELHELARALGDQAIKGKWEIDKLQLELLKATRTGAPLMVAHRETELSESIIEAAVCMTGKLSDIEKQFEPKILEAAHRRFRQGLGLSELVLMCARKNGYRGNSIKDLGPVLKAAFADINAAGGGAVVSTYSLPGILANVANKFIRDAFNAVENTWRSIAAIGSASDFKEISTYSLTGDLEYEEVPPGGEIKHGTLGEEAYTNQLETYAKMIGIDRRDLINDDLGAFTQLSRRLGRGAALKLNKVFWTEFMDNTAFFTAARGNFDNGADSALDSDGLESANLLFLNQTDPDGNPLSVMPKILLVPNALQVTAWRLINSQIMPGTTDAANPWTGKFTVVSSSYLSNSAITGNSVTKWYLLGDPNDLPVIEVRFLNGQESPTVESSELDWNRLGISFRGFHDFGAKLQEYRAGVAMAGV